MRAYRIIEYYQDDEQWYKVQLRKRFVFAYWANHDGKLYRLLTGAEEAVGMAQRSDKVNALPVKVVRTYENT